MRRTIEIPVAHRTSRSAGLGLAVALGMMLLVLSFSRLLGDSQSAAMDTPVLDVVFETYGWNTALTRNLAMFVLSLIVLHLAYALCCWTLARLSSSLWPSAKTGLKHHVLLWFVVVTIALLVCNAAHFPTSSLGEPYENVARRSLIGVPVWLWISAPVAAAAAFTLAKSLFTQRAIALCAGVAAIGAALAVVLPRSHHQGTASRSRPNVILIGLDSLRGDMLFPTRSPEVTPNLNAFLSEAVAFPDAITPLARTFPSMTTLLSGRHPHRTGAVMNLLPRTQIHEGDTLPRILERAGYTTAYATDEVRFSNIDATYGFDVAVTPPIGASEFLLSFFADTPLSNQVMNSWLGAALFPHIHANRGASLTYDPSSFVDRIDDEIEWREPLFLTVHLTLPHWPYTWKDSPKVGSQKPADETQRPKVPAYYQRVVKRADAQFAELLDLLARRGVLGNAIVVVYSDHGETFGYDSESILPVDGSAVTSLAIAPTWGHGTSVLALDQYRVVLAMRGYGGNGNRFPAAGRQCDVPVALQDVAPTIAGLLGLVPREPFDGQTLVPLLRVETDAQAAFSGRVRYFETEFTPSNLATPSGAVSASTVAAVTGFYDLDPVTDRLQVKPARMATLLQNRQYAALTQNWLLAAIPTKDEQRFVYLAIDRANPTAPPRRGPPDAASPPELHAAWRGLQREFGHILQAAPTAGRL
jgi:arylsulfatase A-like enzyme